MRLKTVLTSFFIVAISMAQPLWAGEARDVLDHFHAELETLQAHFEQKLINDKGEIQQQVEGEVYIQRPGLFRWDYSAPYEQMIMADRRKLMIFDADLEQLTIKEMDEALGQSPAVILSRDTDLDENFYIFELSPKDGLLRVELAPRNKEGSFNRMTLGFRGNVLARMVLEDSFGQLTIITLDHVEMNKKLPAGTFEFEPPEGTDVVGDL